MMKISKTVIITLFNLFSVVLSAQDKDFRPTYLFEGKLENSSKRYNVRMNFLILLDSSIVGSYNYNPRNGNLDLAGKLNKDNSFTLSEWFENNNTGTFKGVLSQNKKSIKGIWKSANGEFYNFKLNQVKDESYWSIIKKNRSLFEYKDMISIKNNLNKILSIDLADKNLNNLPIYFSKLSKIESINLLGNKFEKFPEILTELKTLDEISLSTNGLKEIPIQIRKLKNLKILILNNNRLTKIPSEIGELTELKYIDLGNNSLSKLPNEIRLLIKLEEIHLERNNFSEIEKEKIKNLLPKCIIHF